VNARVAKNREMLVVDIPKDIGCQAFPNKPPGSEYSQCRPHNQPPPGSDNDDNEPQCIDLWGKCTDREIDAHACCESAHGEVECMVFPGKDEASAYSQCRPFYDPPPPVEEPSPPTSSPIQIHIPCIDLWGECTGSESQGNACCGSSGGNAECMIFPDKEYPYSQCRPADNPSPI